jgi:MFS family permease
MTRATKSEGLGGEAERISKEVGRIRRKIYYSLVIFTLASSSYFVGFCEASAAPILGILTQELEWEGDRKVFRQMMAICLPLVGITLASYSFNFFFRNLKPYEFLFKIKIAILGFISTSLIPSDNGFMFSRFMQGLVIGYAHTCGYKTIQEFCHKAHRKRVKIFSRLMFSIGFGANFYASRYVIEQLINWRLLYAGSIAFCLIDLVIFTCVVSIDISAFHKFKKKGRTAAKKMVGYYLNTIATRELLAEIREIVKDVKKIEKQEEEANTFFQKKIVAV